MYYYSQIVCSLYIKYSRIIWKTNKQTIIMHKIGRQEGQSLHLVGSLRKETASVYSFSSVQFSCSVMSDSLRPHGLQHTRPPCPSPTPRAYSNPYPLSQQCHPTISSSVSSFSSAINLSQHPGLFKWISSLNHMAKVLEFQLQNQSFQWMFRTDLLQDGLVGSPWSPRYSQESSPTPQFKSINSSVLSFLYSPTLISIHD